jgi:hypothetical protein
LKSLDTVIKAPPDFSRTTSPILNTIAPSPSYGKGAQDYSRPTFLNRPTTTQKYFAIAVRAALRQHPTCSKDCSSGYFALRQAFTGGALPEPGRGSVMTPNRFIIAGALLALLSISATVNRVRRGRIYQRGRHGRIDRKQQPVRFWSSVAAGAILALLGLAMFICGILQKL